MFYKEYVDEEFLQSYISSPEMKNLYPIQITDLRHQFDHFTPEKNQLFEEFEDDHNMKRLLIILVRHRQVEMISDGKKLLKLELYKN